MFWKILSRTIQHIWGLSGLVMEIIGIISNPMGPFGLSILAWGAILFTIWALSVIVQLGWHIHKTENSYAYTLAFEGPDIISGYNVGGFRFALNFKNTLDRPLEYKIDINKTYIKLGSDFAQLKYENEIAGGVIPKLQKEIFILPEIDMPTKLPIKGILHYELKYGCVKNLKFSQKKTFELELMAGRLIGGNPTIHFVSRQTYEEDKPIKKLENPIQIKDLRCL